MANLAHVVVGIDGSGSAGKALEWAIAQPATRRITAVHGFSPSHEMLAAAVQINLDPIRAERVEDLEGVWTKPVRESDTELVRTVFVDEDPVRALLDAAEAGHADAIVVGHRGHGWWNEHHLGHTASSLLHRSDTPVVIVGDRSRSVDPSGPIVVGVHGSPDERHHNAEWAMDLARASGLGVHFVAVSEPPAYIGTGYLADYDAIHAADRDALDRLINSYRSRQTGLGISSEVRDGRALDMLLAASSEVGASLIVIGSHHHHPITGFLTGSVARHLPLLAECPVATIPVR